MFIRYLVLWFVIILFMLASVNSTDRCDIDINKKCGRDVSEERCLEINCCYMATNLSTYNCFHKKNATFPQPSYKPRSENNAGEINPPGTIQLPNNIDQHLDTLQSKKKTKIPFSGIIQMTEWLDKFLKEKGSNSGVNWNLSKKNVFDAVVKVEPDSFNKEVVFESGTKIQVQPSAQHGWKNISFIVYIEYLTLAENLKNKSYETSKESMKNQNENISCPTEEKLVDNATIISVIAYDENTNKIPVAVEFSFHNLNKDNRSVSCEYLNETSSHWSSNGCYVLNIGPRSVTCGCNHTTKFSVLFVVQSLPFEVDIFHLSNIQVVEFVMEGLSFVCLLITFLSLIIVLQRRSKSSTSASARAKERTVVHVNFVAALFALHLTRLVSEAAFANNLICILTVISSHYFMLASGIWMLIEGIVLYLTVIIKSMKHAKLGWYKFVAGWGVPVIIVTISAGIGLSKGTYIQKLQRKWECVSDNTAEQKEMTELETLPYEYCWLSIDSNMIWSASGPLLVIFAINLFILSHTVCFVLKLSIKSDAFKPSGQKAQNGQHIWNTTKGILILFPILGVPWLIGFLVNVPIYQVSLTFQYIHVTLNGLQGVFIFILYSAVNKEVRDTLKRVLKTKWQQHKISVSRSYNTSTQAAKERYKKSITSFMGHNCSPMHTRKRYSQRPGSQISQQSFNTQRPSLASASTNSTVFRFKRKYSTTSSEHVYQAISPGCTGSLPRGWGYRSTPQVTRTPSTRSLRSDISHCSSIPKTCIVCGPLHKICRHDVVNGLTLEPGDPILNYFDFQNNFELEPTINQRWHRMTAEEFKRFSAIPEEKRRSGVNSFIVESNDGLSSLSQRWGKKAKTIERTNVSQKYGNKYCVAVDIHTNEDDDDTLSNSSDTNTAVSSSSIKTSLESSDQLNKSTKNPICMEINNTDMTKNKSKCNSQPYTESEVESTKLDTSSSQTKPRMQTPEKIKRESERMSIYSEQLIKAVERWKAESQNTNEAD